MNGAVRRSARLGAQAEPDDAALVERARAGDEAAVRALVRRHNRRLFRVARGVLRDDGEAEDVVQETYVRAFTHLSRFRGDAGIATWLTRIALNEAFGRLRRRRPEEDGAGMAERVADDPRIVAFPAPPAPTPEAEAGRAQARALLEPLIDALPPAFRIVLILRDVEGMTTEEVATHLAIRPETAKTRLHRGRRLLRAALLDRLGGGFGDLYPFDGARCAGMADRVIARRRERQGPEGKDLDGRPVDGCGPRASPHIEGQIKQGAPAMKCPVDGSELVMTERSGVEIDYCPKCRGVWLDRGELDKVIDRAAPAAAPMAPAREAPVHSGGRRYDDDGYHPKPHRRKREGFLGDLFDF